VGLYDLGCEGNPNHLGLFEDGSASRYSSLSEPEDALSVDRESFPKNINRLKKQKLASKFNMLGVPKCIQFAESIKEVGARVRRKRQKESGAQQICDGGDLQGGGQEDKGCAAETIVVNEATGRRREGLQIMKRTPVSLPSGINLISGSDVSGRSVSPDQSDKGEKEKVIQAAKLLNIQKEVGFNFTEPEEETINHLVQKEKCDRDNKMAWEHRNGDQ
jgi:hypothetical protein